MKKLFFLLLIVPSFLFSDPITIILDGRQFKGNIDLNGEVDCKYYDDEIAIRKSLMPDVEGQILFSGFRLRTFTETISFLGKQELLFSFYFSAKSDDKTERSIIEYTKMKFYRINKMEYELTHSSLTNITYNKVRNIEKSSDGEDNFIKYSLLRREFEFDDRGRPTSIYIAAKGEAWLIYWNTEYYENKPVPVTVEPYFDPETGELLPPRRQPDNSIDLKTEAEILAYLQDHNYTITYTEPVDGQEVKTMEMKFSKDAELKELFMRKVDYMDGTIGESITVAFDKGKKISEVRGK